MFCQLEALQDCLPASVRRILKELPESLDETYERILREIKRSNRLLQCLTVAIRPLRVEELAELLAYDFNAADGGIPKANANWRRGDHEQAVLSTCTSLIAVVGDGGTRVVQFSHFSVKEFLTSNRLSTSGGDVAHHHISLELAHTLLTRACLGTCYLYHPYLSLRVVTGLAFLWLDTLLNIGWLMPGLTRCYHEYKVGCNCSLTQANHILLLGSRCTM